MERRNYPEKIIYHYEHQADLPLQVTHGVWGGINPHGEIELSFYHESDMPPAISEQQIGADGIPGPERNASGDNCRHIVRKLHTRILINYETARALQEWLDQRVAELDSQSAPEVYEQGSGIQQ